VTQRGWVGEARLFGAFDEPLAPPLTFDVDSPLALSHHLGRYVLVTGAIRRDPGGYDELQATRLPSTLLTGTAPLPATSEPLAPVGTAATRPSRSMLWAHETAGVTWLGWLDNEQTAAPPSDRIRATLIHPRHVAP